MKRPKNKIGMTLKDIYRTIIRLFAIFLFLSTVSSLIARIPNTFYFENNLGAIINLIAAFLILLGVFLAIIYKTDLIIRLLRLERNQTIHEIKINNFTELNIIKTSILIISLYFFMTYLPSFIFESIAYFGRPPEASEGIVGH